MDLIQDNGMGDYHIVGYGDGYVQVNQDKLVQSFVITLTQLVVPWSAKTVATLTAADIQAVLDIHPQPALVLLGTGNELVFPKPEQLASLYQQNIGVEIMTTAAACRTHTVLISEGRDIVSAMIIDQSSSA